MAQNILTTQLQQLDGTGFTLARRTSTFTDSAPTAGDFIQGLLPDTTETTIGLTAIVAQVRQLHLKNTHATAKITVKWTPNGGAKATIFVLGPGDGIAFWNQNAGATFGISLLTLTSDTNNTPFELFLGG